MAQLVIDTDTTDGATLQSCIFEVAANHIGITGNLSLDENGDRIYAPYTIWGYFEIDDEFDSKECGFYGPETESIICDNKLIEIG